MSKSSKDEIAAIVEEEKRMDAMAYRMTDAERLHIMDMGFYNEVIKGYLIEAMKCADADFTREDIKSALRGLKDSFDLTAAADAIEVYRNF